MAKVIRRQENAADRRDRKVTLEVVEDATQSSEANTAATIASFLTTVRTNFRVASDAASTLRKNQKEDFEFRDGSRQWDETARQERAVDGRPCLTINRIPQFIRQVTNAQRNANLAIKVSPVDDNADLKVAEVFQGLIRNIEQQSDAQVAYSTASDHQVTGGMGFWRLVTEYSDETSFLQDIKIKRVQNPFCVYWDPAVQEADFSDARFFIVVQDIPKDEFRQRFGDDAFNSLSMFQSTGDAIPEWAPDTAVRIAEYWYVEKRKELLYLIETSDGARDTIFKGEYDSLAEVAKTQSLTAPRIVAQRTAERRKVFSALVCQNRILEGNETKTAGREWPGKYIPIVPVLGDEIVLNGKVDYRGMVRDARDPQRLYNYQNTALAETLALAPKTPWVGYLGQFQGLEAKWKLANRKNFAYLEVNPTSVDGKVVPLPRRETSEPPIAAIVTAIAQADNDLKATMGLFDPSLGARSNAQQSGKAIIALKQQGELANSNFLDNLSRSLRHTGRILIDLIPKIYDAPRVVRYMGLDEQEKAVVVHAGNSDAATALEQFYKESGVSGIYDLNAGRYDVVVSAGPSLQTKRQEAATGLTELMKAIPEAFPYIGDLVVSNLDFPGAQAAAKRLKAMVPPAALQEDQDQGMSPEAMQQIQVMQQQLQELQMLNQELMLEQERRTIEAETKRLETQAKIEIAKLEAQIEMAIAHEDNLTKVRVEEMKSKVTLLEQAIDNAHDIDLAHQGALQQAQTQGREHAARFAGDRLKMQADASKQGRDHQFQSADVQQKLRADERKQARDHAFQAASQAHQARTTERQQGRDHGAQSAQQARDLSAQRDSQSRDLAAKASLARETAKAKAAKPQSRDKK